ncbi:hypothetical protein P3TCK_04251 [Photobacterium profundum 3TCK]|uniref:Uncharacterized protein n=1 Tax=Photobacterium profundum 3TCK TaxID=314280 RepID=Q1ZAD5_9GAMM|nr:hypothetical protein P3TCK_04251 [Photobacterium profundum 3TCK]
MIISVMDSDSCGGQIHRATVRRELELIRLCCK